VHEKTLQWLDETFDHVQKKVDDQEFDKKIDAVKEKHQEAKERRKKQTQAVVHKKVEKMKKFLDDTGDDYADAASEWVDKTSNNVIDYTNSWLDFLGDVADVDLEDAQLLDESDIEDESDFEDDYDIDVEVDVDVDIDFDPNEQWDEATSEEVIKTGWLTYLHDLV